MSIKAYKGHFIRDDHNLTRRLEECTLAQKCFYAEELMKQIAEETSQDPENNYESILFHAVPQIKDKFTLEELVAENYVQAWLDMGGPIDLNAFARYLYDHSGVKFCNKLGAEWAFDSALSRIYKRRRLERDYPIWR